MSFLIYKKYNKKSTKSYYNINNIDIDINVDYLVTNIRNKSYKAFLIFMNLEITPNTLKLIFVLVNIKNKKEIPTRKIALGMSCIKKEDLPVEICNLLEIVAYNSRVYEKSEYKNEYKKRVIELEDDVLGFYIGMYDLYIKMSTKKISNNNIKNVKKLDTISHNYIQNVKNLDTTSHNVFNSYHLKNLKDIFLLHRSDFLENLFYNFKQLKKLSKISYTYILHETIKSTFNKNIPELEILLTDSSFMLYYNISPLDQVSKELILKLSKIFKFFFKLKKIEYLSRKLRNIIYIRFVNRVYYYTCIEVIKKYEVSDVDKIMKEMYLEDNGFYKLISQIEEKLMKKLVGGHYEDDEREIKKMMKEMYEKNENEIFIM